MISLRDVVTGFGVRDPLAEVWRRSLRGGGGGAAEITGVPPLRYIGDGRPLTDYRIAGNTVQDGTPTPESPVPVEGCGTDAAGEWTLPLTVNGTEYPIYLGQVETTRRVKKLVLTGNESWSNVSGNAPYRITLTDIVLTTDRNSVLFLSSHYLAVSNSASWSQYSTCVSWAFAGNVNVKCLQFRDTNQATLADFKAYLATQYAAGTPVTVWYVLAEPETAIVNEPLMKIGDYADTINLSQTGIDIPVIKGNNVLTINTDVPPSETYIKYIGKEKEYGYYITSDGYIYTTSDGYKYGIRS